MPKSPEELAASKAISRQKAAEDAVRNLLTAIASVLVAAFVAVPQEKLSDFAMQLGLPGVAGLMVVPLLLGLQRYFASRAKHS